jgi:hypothetical protein
MDNEDTAYMQQPGIRSFRWMLDRIRSKIKSQSIRFVSNVGLNGTNGNDRLRRAACNTLDRQSKRFQTQRVQTALHTPMTTSRLTY